ncbi:Zinc fingerC2H2 type family protein [Aphelenchoides avenae]|nr:Zinc fingerC2H2 type family protein [Aphelenchus avenae]
MILCMETALLPTVEALRTAPVFMQAYSEAVDDSEIVNVPFPFTESDPSDNSFANHPSVLKLRESLSLDTQCGYIVLMRLHGGSTLRGDTPDKDASGDSDRLSASDAIYYTPPRPSKNATVIKDPRKVCSIRAELRDDESFSDFVILDCVFGIPLFDEQLNRSICDRLTSKGLTQSDCFEKIKFANRDLVDSLAAFVKKYQIDGYEPLFDDTNSFAYPTQAIQFDQERTLALPIY